MTDMQKVVELVQCMATCADAAIAAEEVFELGPTLDDGGVIKHELHEDGMTLVMEGGRFRVTVSQDATTEKGPTKKASAKKK